MMEKILGPIPSHMIHRTRYRVLAQGPFPSRLWVNKLLDSLCGMLSGSCGLPAAFPGRPSSLADLLPRPSCLAGTAQDPVWLGCHCLPYPPTQDSTPSLPFQEAEIFLQRGPGLG